MRTRSGICSEPGDSPSPRPCKHRSTNVAVHKRDKLGPFELNGSTVQLIRVRGVFGDILYLPPPDGASVFSFFLDIFWMLPGSPAKCFICRGRKAQSRERKPLMLHTSFANGPTNLVLTEVRHTVILPSCVCLSWHHFKSLASGSSIGRTVLRGVPQGSSDDLPLYLLQVTPVSLVDP